jgi:maltooligosyltrehalose trehalohydrolase
MLNHRNASAPELFHSLGATPHVDGQCRFLLWAPNAGRVEVHIVAPMERLVPLAMKECGYYEAVVQDVAPGSRYFYRLDGVKERPDPASRLQPAGVHGPSQVVDLISFQWQDREWPGSPLEEYVICELHVGTYSSQGTFDAIIPYLDQLTELGVTALEIMPVAQFPGERNWGYDGAFPFAVQNSYGGPAGLQRLVNACHQRGLAIILDVVYNHLGPEGNYLADFGPYFTDHYRTPWGPSLNFDGPYSDQVRRFFVENALYWVTDLHVDALRLDAIHGIVDLSAQPFLAELTHAVHEEAKRVGRRIYLIAESNLNDARVIQPLEAAGYGFDAQWNDDFHHALHVLLTGEKTGYYRDFGELDHLAKAFREGFVYSGAYSAYRKRRHGNSSRDIPASRFVVFAQNHDQVGNRMRGDRLSCLVRFEALKLAAGTVILSPFVPLLFMGEEYGETAPFQYFTSHSDPSLVEAVRRGRQEEFAAFEWPGDAPDPQAESSFLDCKLDLALRGREPHKTLWEFHQELIKLRQHRSALRQLSKQHTEVRALSPKRMLAVRRWSESEDLVIAFNFGEGVNSISAIIPPGSWRVELDSASQRWRGPGSRLGATWLSTGDAVLELNPESFAVLSRPK